MVEATHDFHLHAAWHGRSGFNRFDFRWAGRGRVARVRLAARPLAPSFGCGCRPVPGRGADNLPETRTTITLQPGVTLTTIHRGVPDTTDAWTIEVYSADPNPDPDAPKLAITDQTEANQSAATLTAAALTPRVEAVNTPQTADTGGLLGYRTRVSTFATAADAATTLTAVKATGLSGSAVYTGWDDDAGSAPSQGPWNLDVISIDPHTFTGQLVGDYGPNLYNREPTFALAPGDPAGVAVYHGIIEREATNGRPAFIVHANTGRSEIARLWWHGTLQGAHHNTLTLSGLNRVPGLIRNCGEPGDTPTSQPQQDITCTKASEIVAFDNSYATTTPTGPGTEVVLDATGRIVSINNTRVTTIPAGGRTIQAIGDDATALTTLAQHNTTLRIDSTLFTENGRPLHLTPDETIINGSPLLIQPGQIHTTPAQDGAVHPGQPNYYYGWAHKRNPRTLVGIDCQGRTLLITADGRSTNSLGLSITEEANVAKSLGLQQAMNLDGGGSTTTVINGQVINTPSDTTGQRPIGDALEVLPPT
ncbi:phosphodiester glycosidase family protein [Jatrophihabitans sp. GAS493]|uniref:phosphodiester glycosidase family protein n=1 Tax=Jatrophihabitans sp. GAS493 TaxID=1907575 RepID=UPI000BB99348|nr:phosphodiester glycosidase family protein [Jatrophihabitans sp. GAS493]